MDNSTLSTKLAEGTAEVTVKDGKVTLLDHVTSVFTKEQLIAAISDLNGKIDELAKAIDQTKANILNLEKQSTEVTASRDNFRELLKQVEKPVVDEK